MEWEPCLLVANGHHLRSLLQSHQPVLTSNVRTNPINRSTTHQPTNPITPPTMSSFLTFSRRALGTTTRNTPTLLKPLAAQSFSSAASRQASGETEGKNPDSTHTTRKKDQLDVQSANSKEARE
jgi:hypothetical protein